MAPLGYVLDDIFVEHRAPSGHPERPARAQAARDGLVAAGIVDRGERVEARLATDDELLGVHGAAYLEELEKRLPGKSGWLDPDTYFSPATWDAARKAVGGACALATGVLDGRYASGIAVVRPPGHHATRDQAMGFCILNNVAAAAAAARAAGAARVAIVDWDVHHGNGTQDIFWNDPSVLYLSVHQYPYYPGTGAPGELGGDAARGKTINVGLPSGAGDEDYAAVFDQIFVPALDRFAPELVLVSAGFDAFVYDPLAGMRVSLAGYRAMAERVRAVAERHAGGRIVAVLEGGYDLDGLAGGMREVLGAFVGPPVTPQISPAAMPASGGVRAAIDATIAAHARAGVPLPTPET